MVGIAARACSVSFILIVTASTHIRITLRSPGEESVRADGDSGNHVSKTMDGGGRSWISGTPW